MVSSLCAGKSRSICWSWKLLGNSAFDRIGPLLASLRRSPCGNKTPRSDPLVGVGVCVFDLRGRPEARIIRTLLSNSAGNGAISSPLADTLSGECRMGNARCSGDRRDSRRLFKPLPTRSDPNDDTDIYSYHLPDCRSRLADSANRPSLIIDKRSSYRDFSRRVEQYRFRANFLGCALLHRARGGYSDAPCWVVQPIANHLGRH